MRVILCIAMFLGYLWAYGVGGIAGAVYSAGAAVSEWPMVVLLYRKEEE